MLGDSGWNCMIEMSNRLVRDKWRDESTLLEAGPGADSSGGVASDGIGLTARIQETAL